MIYKLQYTPKDKTWRILGYCNAVWSVVCNMGHQVKNAVKYLMFLQREAELRDVLREMMGRDQMFTPAIAEYTDTNDNQ